MILQSIVSLLLKKNTQNGSITLDKNDLMEMNRCPILIEIDQIKEKITVSIFSEEELIKTASDAVIKKMTGKELTDKEKQAIEFCKQRLKESIEISNKKLMDNKQDKSWMN